MKPAIGVLTQRIREEFGEAPGLQITVEEGVRFWALDAETCAMVLSALHNAGFLVRTQDGRYQRAPGTWHPSYSLIREANTIFSFADRAQVMTAETPSCQSDTSIMKWRRILPIVRGRPCPRDSS